MAIIGIGKINKKILYAFAGGLCKLLPEIILYNIEQQELRSHRLILGLNSGLGMIFAIIPLIYFNKNIKKLNLKKPQNQEYSLNDYQELIYEENIDYYVNDQNSKTLPYMSKYIDRLNISDTPSKKFFFSLKFP